MSESQTTINVPDVQVSTPSCQARDVLEEEDPYLDQSIQSKGLEKISYDMATCSNLRVVLELLVQEIKYFCQMYEEKHEIGYEKLHPLLLQLFQFFEKDKDLINQMNLFLLSNPAVLRCLMLVADSTFKGDIPYATACLMMVCECIRMLTDNNSQMSVLAARTGFVYTVLYGLKLMANNTGYSQLLEAVIMALFGLIQNLAMFTETKCYFESTNFVKILLVYLNKAKPNISLMAVLTLSMLISVIPTEEKKILVFDEEAILGYIQILQQAVLEPDLAAKDVHGSLVVPADDILRLLKHLWHIEANRVKIAKLYTSFMPLLEACLCNSKEIHQIASLDLLWTVITEPDLLVTTAERDTTTAVLVGLLFDERVSIQIRSMASCVFYKLNPEQVEENSTLLNIIKGCYDHGRFSECIDWCHKLLPPKSIPDSLEGHTALLYRGKALFHLYKREQKSLEDSMNLLSRKELYVKQESVYDIAGSVVKSLGRLLDSEPSLCDRESSKCLDISMIDVAIHRNGLREYSRCLLCLNVRTLRRSHLCPDAILNAFASGLERTKNKRIFNLSFFKKGQNKSPHEITLYLFCDGCEDILSRDGETHFVPKFFRKIYNIDSPSQPDEPMHIQYGEWLYRFAIGLVFRGLINEAISSFLNEDEIHDIIAQLRKFVLTKGSLNDLPGKPEIHLLISPNLSGASAGFIGHIYHAPFTFALTNIGLKSGSRFLPRRCQFFLARIGIMNFVLVFGKQPLLPLETVINPVGGEFKVYAENDRASTIPRGILQILEDLAVDIEKNILESTVSIVKQLKLKDPSLPQSQKSDTFMTYDAMSVDVESLSQKGFFPTTFSVKSPQEFNFLPQEFSLDHSNGSLTLPEGHHVIFHGDFLIEDDTSGDYNITFFLAAGSDQCSDVYSLEKPYVIFHRYQPGLKLQLGFFVSPDDLSCCAMLPDPSPKVMLGNVIKQLRIPAFTKLLLPELMKLRGLCSYHSVLHRSFLQRSPSSYDHVCNKRCWYCESRCNHCLAPASYDLNMKSATGSIRKFCSDACRKVYFDSTCKDPIILDLQSSHPLLLSLEVTLLCKTGDYSRADIAIYCGDGSKDICKGVPYVVYHHTTITEQHFLEYFINEDCSFSCMLPYFSSKECPKDMAYAEKFVLTILKEKMLELGIKDLTSLINLCTKSE